jgi:hypothetical protein
MTGSPVVRSSHLVPDLRVRGSRPGRRSSSGPVAPACDPDQQDEGDDHHRSHTDPHQPPRCRRDRRLRPRWRPHGPPRDRPRRRIEGGVEPTFGIASPQPDHFEGSPGPLDRATGLATRVEHRRLRRHLGRQQLGVLTVLEALLHRRRCHPGLNRRGLEQPAGVEHQFASSISADAVANSQSLMAAGDPAAAPTRRPRPAGRRTFAADSSRRSSSSRSSSADHPLGEQVGGPVSDPPTSSSRSRKRRQSSTGPTSSAGPSPR